MMKSKIQDKIVATLTCGAILISASAVFVATGEVGVFAVRATATKYRVCHRTSAIKNPYRSITVAWSSVDGNNNGHDGTAHKGPVFSVALPSATHGTTPRDSGLGGFAGGGNDSWGDIFEARKNGTGTTGGNYNSYNWTLDGSFSGTPNSNGQAIFSGAINTLTGKKACAAMTLREYIASERDAGASMSSIMSDLDDQESSEDAALRSKLGGSFDSWYTTNGGGSQDPELIASQLALQEPADTTESPTNIAATSATLNGTVTPRGASMVWYFEWGTSSSLTSPNETTPSSAVTASQTVSTGITGLTSETIYYYRTVGVVSNGLTGDALVESYFYGTIKQFTFGIPAVTTEPATSVAATTATINGTGTSNGASSTVTFTWGTSSSLASGNTVTTASQSPISSDATGTAASLNLTGLTGGTTYYFRLSISNVNGTASGIIRNFVTTAAPVVTTTTTTTTTPAVTATTTPACVTPTVTANAIPEGYVGEPFSWSPTVSSGTVTWSVSSGSLPNGLTLNSTTGAVTGTPTSAQSATFEISAKPGSCSGAATAGKISVTIVVLPPGRVSGVVWIDVNKNDKQDLKEPVLPGITVTLSSEVTSASVRKRAASTVSGKDGSYLIKGVDLGNYTVVAKISASLGLSKSWDSSGAVDWKVPVTVVSQKESVADFAAVGKATLTGTVVSTTESIVPEGSKVTCTWAGVDGELGNEDDVVFTTSANSSGSYSIPSIPSGSFSCVATDEKSGKSTTPRSLDVKAGTVGVVAITVLKFGGLPVTGSSLAPTLALSILLMVGGMSLLLVTRRRRTRY